MNGFDKFEQYDSPTVFAGVPKKYAEWCAKKAFDEGICGLTGAEILAGLDGDAT